MENILRFTLKGTELIYTKKQPISFLDTDLVIARVHPNKDEDIHRAVTLATLQDTCVPKAATYSWGTYQEEVLTILGSLKTHNLPKQLQPYESETKLPSYCLVNYLLDKFFIRKPYSAIMISSILIILYEQDSFTFEEISDDSYMENRAEMFTYLVSIIGEAPYPLPKELNKENLTMLQLEHPEYSIMSITPDLELSTFQTHVILHELGEKNFLDVHSKICQNKSGESFQKLFPTLNANGLKNIPLNNLDIQKYIKDISDRRRIEAANCF